VEDQTVSIWAGTSGKLDEVPVEDVLRFESEFLDYLKRNSKVIETIRETKNLEDDTIRELDAAIDKFKKGFQTGQGVSLSSLGNEVVNALEEEEVNQEKIVKQKR
jgi:F-type H+-transporting ATPase subunit alpha